MDTCEVGDIWKYSVRYELNTTLQHKNHHNVAMTDNLQTWQKEKKFSPPLEGNLEQKRQKTIKCDLN